MNIEIRRYAPDTLQVVARMADGAHAGEELVYPTPQGWEVTPDGFMVRTLPEALDIAKRRAAAEAARSTEAAAEIDQLIADGELTLANDDMSAALVGRIDKIQPPETAHIPIAEICANCAWTVREAAEEADCHVTRHRHVFVFAQNRVCPDCGMDMDDNHCFAGDPAYLPNAVIAVTRANAVADAQASVRLDGGTQPLMPTEAKRVTPVPGESLAQQTARQAKADEYHAAGGARTMRTLREATSDLGTV